MKKLLLVSLLPVLALAACAPPMDTAGYQKSYGEQRARYPELKDVYRNGQTPAQIRASIKRHQLSTLLAEGVMERPSAGWPAGSLEWFHEQANGGRVSRIDRFEFGSVNGNTAEDVFYHRVYYDGSGRSYGWFVTRL